MYMSMYASAGVCAYVWRLEDKLIGHSLGAIHEVWRKFAHWLGTHKTA